MSVVAAGATIGRERPGRVPLASVAILLLLLLGVPVSMAYPWAADWPAEWVIPLRRWITATLHWMARDLSFGLFTFRDITRGVAALLTWPLDIIQGVLYAGFRSPAVPPVPWIALAGGAVLIGHFLGGARLALLAGLATLYLAVFGLWSDAMRTLSLVLVTAPLAAAGGLILGVIVFKNARAHTALSALFDLMQ